MSYNINLRGWRRTAWPLTHAGYDLIGLDPDHALEIRGPQAHLYGDLVLLAPDLLTALRVIANGPCDHGPGPHCPREIAQAAIAKVEGR